MRSPPAAVYGAMRIAATIASALANRAGSITRPEAAALSSSSAGQIHHPTVVVHGNKDVVVTPINESR